MQLVAERAMTTRQSVGRIEAGEPRVAFGTMLAVLNALGLLDTVSGVAGAENDPVMHAQSTALRSRRARLPGAAKPKPSSQDQP